MTASSLATILTLTCAFWWLGTALPYNEEWGIEVVLYFNNFHSPVSNQLVKIISTLGFELFIPFIVCCCYANRYEDQLFGKKLAILLTEGFWLQSLLKFLYARQRPKWAI
jgi:hypothetical protein